MAKFNLVIYHNLSLSVWLWLKSERNIYMYVKEST